MVSPLPGTLPRPLSSHISTWLAPSFPLGQALPVLLFKIAGPPPSTLFLFSAFSPYHLSPSLCISLMNLFILCSLPSLKNVHSKKKNVYSMNTGSFAVLFTAIPRTLSGNQIFVEKHELINTHEQKHFWMLNMVWAC